MPYLTPNTIPTTTKCYTVRVPNDAYNIAAFVGAVYELARAYNWQEYGEMTPDEMSVSWLALYNTMVINPGGCLVFGQIIALATSAIPGNMLACDGTSYLRVDYPDLYAVLNSTFITDADNFVVPDLRSQFVYGAASFGGVGNVGGSIAKTIAVTNLPAHSHLAHVGSPGVVTIGAGAPAPVVTVDTPAATSNTGGDTDLNIMPPYTRLMYAIVAL